MLVGVCKHMEIAQKYLRLYKSIKFYFWLKKWLKNGITKMRV